MSIFTEFSQNSRDGVGERKFQLHFARSSRLENLIHMNGGLSPQQREHSIVIEISTVIEFSGNLVSYSGNFRKFLFRSPQGMRKSESESFRGKVSEKRWACSFGLYYLGLLFVDMVLIYNIT